VTGTRGAPGAIPPAFAAAVPPGGIGSIVGAGGRVRRALEPTAD
jgi:hypothetical protein